MWRLEGLKDSREGETQIHSSIMIKKDIDKYNYNYNRNMTDCSSNNNNNNKIYKV